MFLFQYPILGIENPFKLNIDNRLIKAKNDN